MFAVDGNIVLPFSTLLCIYAFEFVLFLLAISIMALTYILWMIGPLPSIVHCECRRVEGRKRE